MIAIVLGWVIIFLATRHYLAEVLSRAEQWRKLGFVEREALAVTAGIFWPVLLVFLLVYGVQYALEMRK